jgi:general secretion pathway protein A
MFVYERFYGLKCSAFELSPDPRFFFPTPNHNEALATVSYGVLRRKGFVAVTGEVGTGKTLLIRYLLEFLRHNKVAFAFVYNPKLTVLDFLAYVLNDLQLPIIGRTKGEMLLHLNNYLLAQSRRDATTAIIVDEAHLLDLELLEEIRLLTNFETSRHKLIQILLVGQPELDQKLDSPGQRQLKQRLSLRCQLQPLTFDQLRNYIHRRLELAGMNSRCSSIFLPETLEVIYRFSRGIPRVINNLCENSLICGYGRQMKQITAAIVREVALDLRLNQDAKKAVARTTGTPVPGPIFENELAQWEPQMERR